MAMTANSYAALPFLSWDGIFDGSGGDEGSYIQSTGGAAIGSYVVRASFGPAKADFAARYRAAYATEPDDYTAAGYACTEVVLEALAKVAERGPSSADLREQLRAYAVDPTHRYDTVLGSVGFDANGDSIQQFVTLYRVEQSAAGGAGDWVMSKQQDFGPAP
jgi:ABC-type branched-subunit amino acid transport system substrate-binding protein